VSEDSGTRRFERIVLPHLDAAYNLARWLLRRDQDAEDVVQEAMLRAYRSLDGCREATARPWLLRIVRNAAWDSLNAAGAGKVGNLVDCGVEEGDLIANAFTDPPESPEDLAAAAEDRALLDEMIAALPAGFREVLVLRELEELSYREIAEIAGIPIGTVMSRLARARDMLRSAWRARHE